jgi:hypothetical protein
MCGLCGTLMEGPHWSETGTDAARDTKVASGRQRFLERAYRVRLINRVLERFACRAEDWTGGQYIMRSPNGAADVVTSLPQLWRALETMSGRPADPLDPELIARLEAAEPVGH